MNIQRLQKLSIFLRTKVPVEKFNMSKWAGRPDGRFSEEDVSLSCNTAACAMGWATTIPAFKKLGLKLKPLQSIYADPKEAQLHYKEHTSFEAAQVFMDLNCTQTKYLFSGSEYDNYPTPSEVADRIDHFIKNGGLSCSVVFVTNREQIPRLVLSTRRL